MNPRNFKYLLALLIVNSCCFAISGKNKPALDVEEHDPVRNFITMLKIETIYFDSQGQPDKTKTTSWCAGTLVNGKYIVTALHCLAPRDFKIQTLLSKNGLTFDINKITFYLPKNLNSLDDSLFFNIDMKSQKLAVANAKEFTGEINEIYIPPQNPKWGYYPDLAILKLDQYAWQTQISKVIIPAENQINFKDLSSITAYGWGADYSANSQGVGKAGYLRETPITNLIRSPYPFETKFEIPTYPGDDGAPLLKKIAPNSYQLLGVNSNDGNGGKGWTAAVDLTQYSPWAEKILEKGIIPKGTNRCLAWAVCILPEFARDD